MLRFWDRFHILQEINSVTKKEIWEKRSKYTIISNPELFSVYDLD